MKGGWRGREWREGEREGGGRGREEGVVNVILKPENDFIFINVKPMT